MANTDIEWSQYSMNPVTGCSRISPGCDNCYAARFAHRGLNLRHRGLTYNTSNGLDWTGEIRLHADILERVDHLRKPRRIFLNSMSDLFHPEVPSDFIKQAFDVMERNERHIFQVLTKRPDRLVEMAPGLQWSDHIHMGVTVESGDYLWRMDRLRQVPAAIRFVSFEPLLQSIPNLDLQGIHWAICGGESGPKARPMEVAWVREIRDQCIGAAVPFFFKQWGSYRGNNPDLFDPTAKWNGGRCKGGRLLDGKVWDERPTTVERKENPVNKQTDHKELLAHFQCPICGSRKSRLERRYSECRYNTEFVDCLCENSKGIASVRELVLVRNYIVTKSLGNDGCLVVQEPVLIDEYEGESILEELNCEDCSENSDNAYRLYDKNELPVGDRHEDETVLICENCCNEVEIEEDTR